LRREAAATEIGIAVTRLDKLVQQARRKPDQPGESEGPGRRIIFPKEEAWPDEVDLADDVIDAIGEGLKKLMVMKKPQVLAFCLWVTFTHVFTVFENNPRLNITSSVLRSGKSRLLEIAYELVHRPYLLVNLSAAGFFRLVDGFEPTMLIDEADLLLGDESFDLIAVVNRGFDSSQAHALRVEDGRNGRVLRAYGIFSPLALARIGANPTTIMDRSITLTLERKLQSQKVERLTRAHRNEFRTIRNRIVRWALDHKEGLAEADPKIPPELHDRAADVWRPLFCIADLAGATVGDLARKAAITLSQDNEAATQPREIQALSDVRDYIEALPEQESFTTGELAVALGALEDGAWAEFRHDKPLTRVQLAHLLRNLRLITASTGKDKSGPRGYTRAALEKSFSRYLMPFRSAQPPNPLEEQEE
jgi:hypothetical protein